MGPNMSKLVISISEFLDIETGRVDVQESDPALAVRLREGLGRAVRREGIG